MIIKKIKRVASVVMASTLLLLSAACGNKSNTTVKTSAENESHATDAQAKTAKSGGKVIICNPDTFTTTFLPFSASTGDRFFVAPALESLGRSDIEGNISGWLAESFAVDKAGLSLTITLKDNIKFSDGSAFNADAVIWNFDKMTEGGKTAELGNPEKYEKIDDKTIKLSYKSWANDWEKVLSEVYIYCPAAFEKNGEDWASINAVGTGPYLMTEYVKDDHISYKKNENYWIEGKPYLDELEIVLMTDTTTQQAALMNEEIDMLATNDATLIQTLTAGGFENIAKSAPDLGAIKYIMFASGDKTSPFNNLKVREAVSHSIDWDGYVRSLTGELGKKITQFGVPGAWSYDETVELPEFNVGKAKDLLKEAGYENGFNTVITTITSNNDIAVLLQASLKEIGINAEIKVEENTSFNSKKKEGTYDGGIITGQGASKLDFTNNYIRLYSSKGVNYLNMMDHPADYEEALFGARAASTIPEKKELLKVASKKLVSEYKLILPMAATFSTCFSNDKVKDSGIFQSSSVQWTPEEIKTTK